MSGPSRARRVVMLLENEPFPQDVRVYGEAQALTRGGYAVTVIAPRQGGQARSETVEGIRVKRFRAPDGAGSKRSLVVEYAVAHLQLIPRAVFELARGADAVHVHNPPDTLFPVMLLARAMRRRAVFDHHDSAPELFRSKFGSVRWVERVLRATQRCSFRAASAVIVTNESQRRIAVERGRLPPERVVIVRNGPPEHMMRSARAARGGVIKDPVLAFVGGLESQDGVLQLPELLLEPGLETATLLVIGDGSCRPSMEQTAARLGVAERVRFAGRVPHEEVDELLAQSDICVDPAPCTELNHGSTMIKIAEYMAVRRPIVAYALRETEHTLGGSGVLVPCGEQEAFAHAIVELARDPDRRRALSDAARTRAEDLQWSSSVAALIDAYTTLWA